MVSVVILAFLFRMLLVYTVDDGYSYLYLMLVIGLWFRRRICCCLRLCSVVLVFSDYFNYSEQIKHLLRFQSKDHVCLLFVILKGLYTRLSNTNCMPSFDDLEHNSCRASSTLHLQHINRRNQA
jgi:hypothetical protein